MTYPIDRYTRAGRALSRRRIATRERTGISADLSLKDSEFPPLKQVTSSDRCRNCFALGGDASSLCMTHQNRSEQAKSATGGKAWTSPVTAERKGPGLVGKAGTSSASDR